MASKRKRKLEKKSSKDFKDKVADGTYTPIYYMYGASPRNRHVYFSPKEIYRPPLPESRPETPTEKRLKKEPMQESAQSSFLDNNVNLSQKGMFGTYLENRPPLQAY